MERNEIFKIAMLDYDEELNGLKDTTFAVIEKTIRGINLSDLPEEDKINKLKNIFTQTIGSSERRIMGVKKDELFKIINTIFKLEDGQISNPYLQGFNMDEILYYYCCISRMAKSKIHYSTEEISKIKQEVSEIIKRQEEKIKAEEKAKKEAIKKREKEKRLKEEAERKAEEERLANMSELERKLEDIKNDNREENYVKLYNSLDEFNEADKLAGAKILKEHWIKIEDKWDGKLSKKQANKVAKIKEILGE